MFTLGRFSGVKGPGLIIVMPYVQQMVRIDLRTVVLDVPSQDVISRDNVSVKVNAVLYFRVVDADRAVIQVENFLLATSQLAQTTLRSVLGKHTLDEMLSERDRLNSDIQEILDAQTETGASRSPSVEIKQVDLNETMVRAIGRQAEAERLRRAKIINAEGEQQAAGEAGRGGADAVGHAGRDAVALPRHADRDRRRQELDHRLPLPDRPGEGDRRAGGAAVQGGLTPPRAGAKPPRNDRERRRTMGETFWLDGTWTDTPAAADRAGGPCVLAGLRHLRRRPRLPPPGARPRPALPPRRGLGQGTSGSAAASTAEEIQRAGHRGRQAFPPGRRDLHQAGVLRRRAGHHVSVTETRFVLHLFEAPLPGPGRASPPPCRRCAVRRRRPRRRLAKASCLYPNSDRATREARSRGFDEALMLDPWDNVAEFAFANVMIAQERQGADAARQRHLPRRHHPPPRARRCSTTPASRPARRR